MPKHVPTFKHLLASAQPLRESEYRERSVNELIASSRAQKPVQRDLPPHIVGSERVWAPSSGPSGLPDVEDGGVHPAELLRRSYVSQRLASRSVAGPAPPPSWRGPMAISASTSKSGAEIVLASGPVTTEDLCKASSLFSRSAPEVCSQGSIRLVENCLLTVLHYLNDEEFVHPSEPVEMGESEAYSHGWTRGELMREQVAYLESPLKLALLETSSLQPEGSFLRLSEASLKAVLGYSDDQQFHPDDRADGWDRSSSKSADSWETADTTLHHLPLTLHPSPHIFLRKLPALHSLLLTSLNLAYSTVPIELEKLVNVLPAGLRELGMAGLRVARSKNGGQEDWRRGLGLLARKLIVLRTLDLSYPSIPLSTQILTTLLHPPIVKLPSLKILGLRGVSEPGADTSSEPCEQRLAPLVASEDAVRQWRDVIKKGRQRWIDVIW